jgi:hypothetical protein
MRLCMNLFSCIKQLQFSFDLIRFDSNFCFVRHGLIEFSFRKAIQELKKAEESFIDEINRFLKLVLIPLQVTTEVVYVIIRTIL